MGEKATGSLRVRPDSQPRLELHGAKVTSDAGLLACRELDSALGLTAMAEHGSLTTLREQSIKIGAKVVCHAGCVTFEMAEVAIPRRIFTTILRRVGRRCPVPVSRRTR